MSASAAAVPFGIMSVSCLMPRENVVNSLLYAWKSGASAGCFPKPRLKSSKYCLLFPFAQDHPLSKIRRAQEITSRRWCPRHHLRFADRGDCLAGLPAVLRPLSRGRPVLCCVFESIAKRYQIAVAVEGQPLPCCTLPYPTMHLLVASVAKANEVV